MYHIYLNAPMREQLDDTIRKKGGSARASPRAAAEAKHVQRTNRSQSAGAKHGRRAGRERAPPAVQRRQPEAAGVDEVPKKSRHSRAPVAVEPVGMAKPRPRADVQDDVEILMSYYQQYDSTLAGLDEGLLSFCLPPSRLYGESL